VQLLLAVNDVWRGGSMRSAESLLELYCIAVWQVKILYVRNLMLSTSEETLENIFNQAASRCGAVERVKKIKDYAFIHFHDRDDAMKALHVINGTPCYQFTLSLFLSRTGYRQPTY